MKKSIGIILALLVASSASAATYHTAKGNPACSDGGAGSVSQPFCTIAAGVGKLAAGDTLLVGSGDYGEAVTLPNKVGTASSWYTVLEEPTNAPESITIRSLTFPSGGGGFWQFGSGGFVALPTSGHGVSIFRTGSGSPYWEHIKIGVKVRKGYAGQSLYWSEGSWGTGWECLSCEASNGGTKIEANAFEWFSHGVALRYTLITSDITGFWYYTSNRIGLEFDRLLVQGSKSHLKLDGDGAIKGYNMADLWIHDSRIIDSCRDSGGTAEGAVNGRKSTAPRVSVLIEKSTLIGCFIKPSSNPMNSGFMSTGDIDSATIRDSILYGWGNTDPTRGGAIYWRGPCPVVIDEHNNAFGGNVRDIADPTGCNGGNDNYGPGDIHGVALLIDLATGVPFPGSPVCNAGSDKKQIGAVPCATGPQPSPSPGASPSPAASPSPIQPSPSPIAPSPSPSPAASPSPSQCPGCPPVSFSTTLTCQIAGTCTSTNNCAVSVQGCSVQ